MVQWSTNGALNMNQNSSQKDTTSISLMKKFIKQQKLSFYF